MKYYCKSKLGNTRYKLADGTLLCKDVPIFRSGYQEYLSDELPNNLVADKNGIINVFRSESEVFSKKTLSSFEGITFVVLHPQNNDSVNSNNWKDLTSGHCQNIRRGEGELSDWAIADIFVKDENAIIDIENGMTGISCGYDAVYISTGEGEANQIDIIGNHVALVQRGRAGKRCSIGDSQKVLISTKVKNACVQLSKAFKTKDQESATQAIEALKEEGLIIDDEEETKDQDNYVLTREDVIEIVKEVLSELNKSSKDEDIKEELNKSPTHDTKARAEILKPNHNLPNYTRDSDFKRHILEEVILTKDGEALLHPLLNGRNIDSLNDSEISTVFISASELKKAHNRGQIVKNTIDHQIYKQPNSPQAINKANREYYWGKAHEKTF